MKRKNNEKLYTTCIWELSLPKKHLTEKYHTLQASWTLKSARNCLGVMFGALLYMAKRPGHYKNWRRSIWRALKCGAGGEWRQMKIKIVR